MAITIQQLDEKRFLIHPPEELAAEIVTFLLKGNYGTLDEGLGSADVGSGYKLPLQGTRTDEVATVYELAEKLAAHLGYKPDSDNMEAVEWVLHSKTEAEYYEIFGV